MKSFPQKDFCERIVIFFFSENIFKTIFQKKAFFFKNDISGPRDRHNKHRLEKLMPPEQFLNSHLPWRPES